jgi:hypothetical protein
MRPPSSFFFFYLLELAQAAEGRGDEETNDGTLLF